MSALFIRNDIAEALEKIASKENRALDSVLLSLLKQYAVSPQQSNWPLEMAALAEGDSDIEWNENAVELSEVRRQTPTPTLPRERGRE